MFTSRMKKTISVFNFSIKQDANKACNIYIDGAIVDASTQQLMKDYWGDETSTSFKSFRDQVNNADAQVFNIYINSTGGHVGDALAIHDLIQGMKKKGKTCNTYGQGIVASSATYILMAGEKPCMTKNSWFMIHNVSGGVWGTVVEVENYAKTLRKFNDRSRDFYSEYTGLSGTKISNMMDVDTWMTADEALTQGFIKEVTASMEFTQQISQDAWQYSNTDVLAAYNNAVSKHPTATDQSFITNQFEDMKKFFTDILNSLKGVSTTATPAEMLTGIQNALKPLETMDTEVGTVVNAAVAPAVETALKGEAVQNLINAAVKTAVENAVKPLNDKITDLEKKNGELTTDIENKVGGKTTPKQEAQEVVPIGSFV